MNKKNIAIILIIFAAVFGITSVYFLKRVKIDICTDNIIDMPVEEGGYAENENYKIYTENMQVYILNKDTNKKIGLYHDLINDKDKTASHIKLSGKNIYFIETERSSGQKIVEMNLENFERKVLYQTKNQINRVKVFGILLKNSVVSFDAYGENLIADYLLCNDRIIIINDNGIKSYDGIKEKQLLECKARNVYAEEGKLYYTDYEGNAQSIILD